MDGQRAAESVIFVLRLDDAAGRRLFVEGTVEIDPQARLVAGRWVEGNGATTRSGVISSSALDFFGRQGDRPSPGGPVNIGRASARLTG